MQIRNIAKASLRLLVVPITGAVDGMKEAINRPRATNWGKQFILNDVKAFSIYIFAHSHVAFLGILEEVPQTANYVASFSWRPQQEGIPLYMTAGIYFFI